MAKDMLFLKHLICWIIVAFIFQDIHGQSSLDCNFEDNFCKWDQDDSDDIYWKRWQGNSGDYYIDVSGNGRRHKARLTSSRQTPGQNCLTFLYGMSESYQGALKVFVSYIDGSEHHVFTSAVTVNKVWTLAVISLNTSSEYKVVIEGKQNLNYNRYYYDTVWLDNILIDHELCKDCRDPSPKNGKANATTFQHGSIVEITCDTGYNLTGSPFIECQANGVWSNITKCDLFDCGNRTIINGKLSAIDGTTFGSTATQICDTGYSLVGNAKVNCTTFGWSNLEARCEIAEKGKLSVTAIYVVIPVIVVATAIVFTIVFLRKRLPKCMNVMNSTNKSQNRQNMPYCNETYNREIPQGQNYANMSNSDEPNRSIKEYAIISEYSSDSVKYSNNGAYQNDDKHHYDHTKPKAFEDTTYSHISGNRSNHTDESSYDTTLDLKSRFLPRMAGLANKDNGYNVINVTANIQTARSQAKNLIEELDYDHANAAGPDPTSGDLNGYSHIHGGKTNAKTPVFLDRYQDNQQLFEYSCVKDRDRKERITGKKSIIRNKQQEVHTYKNKAEKGTEIDEDRPAFVCEVEKIPCGNLEEETHTYFVLEKTNT